MSVALIGAAIVKIFLLIKQDGYKVSCYGDTRVIELIPQRKSYQEYEKLFSEIPLQAWDQRYFYSLSFSRILALKATKRWIKATPNSSDAWLVYGATMLIRSWNARGFGRGYEVSKRRWKKFHKLLEKTRVILLKAAELNDKDPTPWAYLIMVATWASDDDMVKDEYFNKAIQRDSENWPAHLHMIIALSKKWGGSHKAMYKFARNAALSARPGSDVPVILIKAHLEYYKYLAEFENNEQAAEHFLNSNDTKWESVKIYKNTLAHPDHKDTKTTIFARYNFSGWLWALKDIELLKNEFRIIGDSIDSDHWTWVGFFDQLDEAKKCAHETSV